MRKLRYGIVHVKICIVYLIWDNGRIKGTSHIHSGFYKSVVYYEYDR